MEYFSTIVANVGWLRVGFRASDSHARHARNPFFRGDSCGEEALERMRIKCEAGNDLSKPFSPPVHRKKDSKWRFFHRSKNSGQRESNPHGQLGRLELYH